MHILTVLVSLSLASAAIAQLSKPLPDPMFPNGSHRIDVQTVVGNNGCLGCARDLQGNYWVSSRAPGLTGRHKLYKLGPNGALLNTYDQPSTYAATAVTGAGPWGMRDLAYDGRYIYGGEENVCSGFKVYAFDTITNTFDSTRYWTAPASTVIVRALVFDPTGNSNQGTMWSGDFGAAVVEFDRNGTVLRTVAATSLVTPGQTAAIYGAAWDPGHRTVWWFSQGGSSKGIAAPNGVQVVGVEMETVTLGRTGKMFFGDLTVPYSPTLGGIAGGCEFYVKNNQPTLLCLAQATSDMIYELHGRYHFGQTCGGQNGFAGEAPFGGNANHSLKLENTPYATGIGVVLLSAGSGSLPVGPPLFGNNCFLNVDIVQGLFVLGQAPIAANQATLALPIPNNILGEVTTQWASVSGTSPVLLSEGGRMYVFP